MPELPEVETVRDGLERHVVGLGVVSAAVHAHQSVRLHEGGAADLESRVAGLRLAAAVRRGKFLWLPLSDASGPTGEALLAHLGMSGQLLVSDAPAPERRHLRARFVLDDGRRVLDLVDQRMFGYLAVAELVPTPDGLPGGHGAPDALVPAPVAHVARDLLDPAVDVRALARAAKTRRTAVKRLLLDQTFVSGVGNIYADEALWRARVHHASPAHAVSVARLADLFAAARAVMTESLAVGGTSFDSLYVNVNGESGYFARGLDAYGREGEPCRRCGTPLRREAFTNRSSFFCPTCQPRR